MDKRVSQHRLTKEKRKTQTCKVFELKIDRSHLSGKTIQKLSQLFVETKWFYNYCLSYKDVNDVDTTAKSVPVKIQDVFEDRVFSVLGGAMKQGIKARLFGSLSALKALKQNGRKVGRLKFKSKINSVPLKQLGGTNRSRTGTHYIDKEKSRIRIQGIKSWLRVNGLEQIPENCELANATLVRKVNDFYLHVTTFTDKKEKIVPETSIGIDFGCQTPLMFSDGTKVIFEVPVSKRLRRLDRRITRKQFAGNFRTDSKNKWQERNKRRKEYEKLTNKKKDIRRKIVNAITKNYKYVCFQDESIHAWQSGNHGKKIQSTGIGGIIADLKNKSHTPIMVDKFFPSTQLCPNCGMKNKLGLDERIYHCECGYSCDRDVKSALCIEAEAMKRVPVDYRDFKAGEISSSTFFNTLSKINGIEVSKMESVNQEKPRCEVSHYDLRTDGHDALLLTALPKIGFVSEM